jgi:hypothetical protein
VEGSVQGVGGGHGARVGVGWERGAGSLLTWSGDIRGDQIWVQTHSCSLMRDGYSGANCTLPVNRPPT